MDGTTNTHTPNDSDSLGEKKKKLGYCRSSLRAQHSSHSYLQVKKARTTLAGCPWFTYFLCSLLSSVSVRGKTLFLPPKRKTEIEKQAANLPLLYASDPQKPFLAPAPLCIAPESVPSPHPATHLLCLASPASLRGESTV